MADWTWQGILTGLLATGLWAVGATVLTWMKNKWPKYGDLALYWIASFACLGVIWFTATGDVPFSRRKPQITTENIESNVKLWSESVGVAIVKIAAPDSYFGYTLTTKTGTPIQVSRTRSEKTNYLQFSSTATFSPEHQALLGTLTKDQVDTVIQEMTLELAKTHIGFTIASLILPQTGTTTMAQTAVVLQKAELITEMNESEFAARIDDMEFTVSLLRAATPIALRRAAAAGGPHLVGKRAHRLLN